MKIYTKTGDQGETSLFGGQRVSKNNERIEAFGTVDELNAVLGIVRSLETDPQLDGILNRLQNELFILGADLATPFNKDQRIERIGNGQIRKLEQDIDRLESALYPLKNFILPGGNGSAAMLHFARTVCRRAERLCITCRDAEPVSDEAIIYLNRLSDLLFVMARFQNKSSNVGDIPWKSV